MKASILKKDFYRRICIYLKEMFPPRNMGFGLLFFVSAWCGIVLLDHSRYDILLPPGHIFLSGAFTISLMLLLLRIMDELKDLETDLLHFPKRPIPRGAVHSSDLKSFGLFIVGVLFILNMFFTHATFIFFIVFGYTCLMFKYFFLKELISKNIMIALATHNPISYLFFFYVFFVYKNNMTASIQMKPVILLGTVFFCISMSWEIARKIRYPEDETTYQTYSKVLGLGAAILILMIPISISLFVIIYLYHNIFSRFTLYYVIVVYLFVMTIFLRFYKKQKIMFGLKTTIEIFIVNVQSILVFEGIVAICR